MNDDYAFSCGDRDTMQRAANHIGTTLKEFLSKSHRVTSHDELEKYFQMLFILLTVKDAQVYSDSHYKVTSIASMKNDQAYSYFIDRSIELGMLTPTSLSTYTVDKSAADEACVYAKSMLSKLVN